MTELHFRAHIDELDVDQLLVFLKANADVLIVCREFGQREHIHSTIIPYKAKNTFREKLLKAFPCLKGNKSYSIKEVRKKEENLRYICKGRPNDYPDILFSKFTDDEIKNMYKEYWLEHKKYEKVKPTFEIIDGNMGLQKDTSVKKKKAETFMVKLSKTVMTDRMDLVEGLWFYEGYKSDKVIKESMVTYHKALAKILYISLGKAVKNIDDFIFERMYRGLYASLLAECPDHSIIDKKSDDLLNKFIHKI